MQGPTATNPVRLSVWQINRMLGIAGWVYFVRCAELAALKIGWSDDPAERLEALQCGVPRPLEMVTAGAGSKRDEASLHRRYRDLRISGEWFRDEGRLRTYVANVLRRNGPTPWPEPIRYTDIEWATEKAVRRGKAYYTAAYHDELAAPMSCPYPLPHLRPRVYPHGPRGPRRVEKPAQSNFADQSQGFVSQ